MSAFAFSSLGIRTATNVAFPPQKDNVSTVILVALVTLGAALGFEIVDHLVRPSSGKLSQNADRIFSLAFENVADRVNSAF